MPDHVGRKERIGRGGVFGRDRVTFEQGDGHLAADDREKKMPSGPRAQGTSRSGKAKGDANVGSALRSVWQETVREDIPADMLDLLGKLN
ncbi:hypothetical protein ABC347_15725 [Sphingomonas sp. 1P06PA]|uniref:hypothetical protein n=1 Tax=Sphingomonas sp. 1P06PA TaxID=554121 RepID=UPI0039A7485D